MTPLLTTLAPGLLEAGSRLIDWHTAWGEAFFGALAWALVALAVH